VGRRFPSRIKVSTTRRKTMNKPKSKRERQIRRALAISQRNQPPGFRPRRKARRLAARLGETEMTKTLGKMTENELNKKTVAELRTICTDNNIKFLSKDRKSDLITKLVLHG
jgi:hypothetical protein